jgi:hypothetical protein
MWLISNISTGTEVRKGSNYKQGGVGEERGSKETDRCPLTVMMSSGVHIDMT